MIFILFETQKYHFHVSFYSILRNNCQNRTKMDFETRLKVFVLLFGFCTIHALPEPGVWKDVPLPINSPYLYFIKNMYKDTIISVEIHCTPKDTDLNLNVGWVLRYSPCTQEYHNFDGMKEANVAIEQYFQEPRVNLFPDYKYKSVQYMMFSGPEICSAEKMINLPDKTKDPPQNGTVILPNVGEKEASEEAGDQDGGGESTTNQTDTGPGSASEGNGGSSSSGSSKPKSAQGSSRRKREDSSSPAVSLQSSVAMISTEPTTPKPAIPEPNDQKSEYHVAKVWKSGSYIFILKIETDTGEHVDATVTIRMKSKVGYISAFEWPLLIFYGVMGLMYIIYGLVWLVMLACNWRDLLRIQYWIGAVIVLGMLEKAVFFSEYQSIANTGMSVTDGAEVFAEIVSCLKRSLARMLVIIVSLGFGIVKPRLGPAFHKVLFVGGLYFVLATVEACMRSLRRKGDQSTDLMLAQVPLAVLDAAICWWIFSSLMQTVRQLRLRRNIVKLTLYRHFTNTLIFAVLASVIFMVWSVIQIKRKTCLKDWQEIWIDDAFWHLLFSIILLVIMILWRPSSNNQRYAFSPLLDAADDEEEDETVMNDAFDGMKMRSKQANGSPKQKQNTIEDDLKWVEENIPSAISDKASTLLDSDEEIMTAKYEMSKMQ